jgi:hypothetical protein
MGVAVSAGTPPRHVYTPNSAQATRRLVAIERGRDPGELERGGVARCGRARAMRVCMRAALSNGSNPHNHQTWLGGTELARPMEARCVTEQPHVPPAHPLISELHGVTAE